MASELRALVQYVKIDFRKAFHQKNSARALPRKKKGRLVKRKGDFFLTEKQRLCAEFPSPGEPKD